MTHRDTLFLLPPGFADNSRREYCPECAEVWGLLSYFPAVKDSLEVSYQPLAKPRGEMVTLLGEKNQNCPTLVLHSDSPSYEDCGIMQMSGHRFINNARDIGRYYANRFGTPFPRG